MYYVYSNNPKWIEYPNLQQYYIYNLQHWTRIQRTYFFTYKNEKSRSSRTLFRVTYNFHFS